MRNIIFAILILLLPVCVYAQQGTGVGIGNYRVYTFSSGLSKSLGKFVTLDNKPIELDKIDNSYKGDEYFNAYSDNFYLLDTVDKRILFDAITADVSAILKEAGYNPDDIDIICLTHMHADSIIGLIANDKAVFTKAQIYIANEEIEYWSKTTDNSDNSKVAKKVLNLYKDRIKGFSKNSVITKGVLSIPAFGHTPGHTVYKITDDNKYWGGVILRAYPDEAVLIIGDIIYAEVQFSSPDINILGYDYNPQQAAETRNKIMQMASDKMFLIAGMHIMVPGMGNVKKQAYIFIPSNSMARENIMSKGRNF